MKYLSTPLAVLAVVTLLFAAGGCSNNAAGGSDVDQQKKDVMGGPAPASAQAQIAADKAKASEMAAQGLAKAAQQKPQGQ
jgi:hypothetical protein